MIQRWIVPRVMIPRKLNLDSGFWFHVELWPGSWFNVELWSQVMILFWIMTRVWIARWIVTPGSESTLNYGSGRG